MNSEIVISVVLGTYNRKRYLKKTINNLRGELEKVQVQSEIIVVDGGSDDGSIAWLAKQKDIILILQHNRGKWKDKAIERRSWGYFMNLAFKCAQGKYICMLSDDCLLIPESLKNGIEDFEQLISQGKRVGALAFHWRNWPSCNKYFVIKVKGQVYLNHGIYLRKALEEVNYINEKDYYFYCADTDLSFRIVNAGYSVEVTNRSIVEHSQHINIKVRKSNKGKNKERLRHDEDSLQKNWSIFFGKEKYRNVVEYQENEKITADDTIAINGFGSAYKIECYRARLNYWVFQFPRQVWGKINS